MSSKGQITVPAEIRKKLNLRKGDQVDFEFDGEVVKLIPKKGTLEDLMNCLPKSKVSYTVEEMNEAIAKAACQSGK